MSYISFLVIALVGAVFLGHNIILYLFFLAFSWAGTQFFVKGSKRDALLSISYKITAALLVPTIDDEEYVDENNIVKIKEVLWDNENQEHDGLESL
jgi:hypothetical protein